MSAPQSSAVATGSPATIGPKKKRTFFSLPTELRLIVYFEYFAALPIRRRLVRNSSLHEPPPLRAHAVIKEEALRTYYDLLCKTRQELMNEKDMFVAQDHWTFDYFRNRHPWFWARYSDPHAAAMRSFGSEKRTWRARIQFASQQLDNVLREMERVEQELAEMEESE